MKIYTKTGDQGETSLYNRDRVPKNHVIIEALGSIDETNAAIGMARTLMPSINEVQTGKSQLESVQGALFAIGALVANPHSNAGTADNLANEICALEAWIDCMEAILPPLTHFILPGGHSGAAALHIARTECRKAERRLVALSAHLSLSKEVLIYFNRLSDYLFMAARSCNFLTGTKETIWTPHKPFN